MEKQDDIKNLYPHAKAMIFQTIFGFIVTYLYLVIFSGIKPGPSITGVIVGVAFFFLGWSVIAVIVTMPIFVLWTKAPPLGCLTSIVNFGLTIFLTRMIYLWLFTEMFPH